MGSNTDSLKGGKLHSFKVRKKVNDKYKMIVAGVAEGANTRKGHKGFVPVPEDRQKSKVVCFNVTPTEKEAIKLAAQIMDVKASTLIRRALRAYLMGEEVAATEANEKQGQLFED